MRAMMHGFNVRVVPLPVDTVLRTARLGTGY